MKHRRNMFDLLLYIPKLSLSFAMLSGYTEGRLDTAGSKQVWTEVPWQIRLLTCAAKNNSYSCFWQAFSKFRKTEGNHKVYLGKGEVRAHLATHARDIQDCCRMLQEVKKLGFPASTTARYVLTLAIKWMLPPYFSEGVTQEHWLDSSRNLKWGTSGKQDWEISTMRNHTKHKGRYHMLKWACLLEVCLFFLSLSPEIH